MNHLCLFTTNYPFGKGETFLENEIPFLANSFGSVLVVPLWSEDALRPTPSNVTVSSPLLSFVPKGNIKLVFKGLFNFAPLSPLLRCFFSEKAYTSKLKLWDYATALLITRSIYFRVKRLIKSDDLLYFYWGDKSAMVAPLLKRRMTNKIVARFHRGDLYEEVKHSRYIPFRELTFRNIDVAVPIAEAGKSYLQEKYGCHAPKSIEVHKLGVFDRGLNPSSSDAVFHIVSCSGLVPVKRISLLAQAIGLLDFPVRWTHIGDGPCRKEVAEIVKDFPKHVEAVPLGAVPNSEVIGFYKSHHIDIFVNVSDSEGIPVSIMEAISFGIPVLATDVGGTSEIVDDTVGKLINADLTPEQLVTEINELRCRLANDGMKSVQPRMKWQNDFNAKKNYSEFCEMLKSFAE